ncbi:MAG TPA: SusD/RagB family nutrient-binding outer membrane lipoprotein [Cyclobacteriaceae bacterium]
MKHMKQLILKTIIGAVLIGVSGCKDFLDINDNPNAPTTSTAAKLLPSAQLAVTFAVDNGGGGLSAYTAFLTQQYVVRGPLNDYQPRAVDLSVAGSWGNFFTNALPDIERIIKQSTELEEWQYVGIAQILKAYSFSVMVDMWGDVPYFQVAKGAEALYPAFDPGDKIYDDLFLLLDEAIANLAKPSSLKPASDDLFYGGNMDRWRKFAKTLKLRMYNQVRLVKDVSAPVKQLLAENDLIGSNADDFQMKFGTSFSPENRNPGYSQEWQESGSNYQINPYFYEIMRSIDTFDHKGIQFGVVDPRIPYYFFNQLKVGSKDSDAQNKCAYCPSRTGTSFLSLFQFSFNIDPNEGFDQGKSRTIAGLYPLGGRYDDGKGGIASNASTLSSGRVSGTGTAPQRILTFYQRKYIEAELALAGVSGGDARALLSSAIDASFAKVNDIATDAAAPVITGAAVITYRDAILAKYDAADATGKLEIIMTQKWIASFGYSVDNFNDFRRTGFPRMHDGNTDNNPVTVRKFGYVMSLPYQLTDLVTYGDTRLTQRNVYTDKVFWAK